MNTPEREHWSRGLGFTLAAVGSAVGLGNMWRFSYMTAENGGAAFVLLYVVLTALIGLPVMLAELTLGRGAARSPIQALAHYGGPRWRPLGALFVLAGFVILSYYSVIAGWTLRYAAEGLLFGFSTEVGAHFGEISRGWDAVAWHCGFMVLTIAFVAAGVRGGIERAALVLMPLLGVLVIGLAIYAATLDGAGAGYAYYFTTDFSSLLNFDVARDAAGQAFFSLSLGMGCILTYASYLKRDHNLPKEAMMVAVSDFSVALIAGLVVFPLLFALGLQSEVIGVGDSAVGALFVTLPKAFATMQAAGRVVGVVFMLALSLAALTSAISLLEVVVSSSMDSFGLRRKHAVWLGGFAIALLGIPSALDTSILEVMDSIGGAFLLVLGGLLLSLFVGWRVENPIAEAAAGRSYPGLRLWYFLLRWVAPPILALMAWFLFEDSLEKVRALLASP